MTTAGAGSQEGARRPGPGRALRGLSDRTSLRTKLIAALLALVTVALVAISVSSGWVLRSYLTRRIDSGMQSQPTTTSSATREATAPAAACQSAGLSCDQRPGRRAGGQGPPSQPSWPASIGAATCAGCGVPSRSRTCPPAWRWLANTNNGTPVTVQAQSGDDTWRVITGPVSYQADNHGQARAGHRDAGRGHRPRQHQRARSDRLAGRELIVGLSSWSSCAGRVRGGAGEPAAAGGHRGDGGGDRGRAPEPAGA